jgi:hypothetical protein
VECKSVGPRGAAALADALRAGAALTELRAARNPQLGCAQAPCVAEHIRCSCTPHAF